MVPVNRTVGAVGRTAEEGQQAPVGHAMERNVGHADAEPLVVTGLMRPDRHL